MLHNTSSAVKTALSGLSRTFTGLHELHRSGKLLSRSFLTLEQACTSFTGPLGKLKPLCQIFHAHKQPCTCITVPPQRWKQLSSSFLVFNPLTTNDDYIRHRNSAACYQLAQSVLKIGSAVAERVGQEEVGWCTALANSAWRLFQLAIEKAWSALDGPFFCFLVQTSVENGAFTLYGLHFWLFRQLSVWRSILWSEGPDCWTLGNEFPGTYTGLDELHSTSLAVKTTLSGLSAHKQACTSFTVPPP